MDPATLRIGLAGLGTVGTGVLRLLAENGALVDRRAGRPIRVVAVSARDRSRDRGVDLSAFPWRDDPAAMIDEVDVVVEMIGGADGPALALTGAALAHGRAVVTANKAMIAHHGLVLAEQAERADVPFKYEAAVAGGIPVIKAIREGASANRLTAVLGILNGTCNHILTTMEATGRAQADVLAEAQALGLAEADPATDIGGADAAHKLAILSALCFGTRLDLAAVTVAGIGGVSATDIAEARALGHRVRLVGRAEWAGGRLAQSVGPVLVPDAHPLAHVLGCQNAIVAEGNYVGRLFFEGAGAGAGPTASADRRRPDRHRARRIRAALRHAGGGAGGGRDRGPGCAMREDVPALRRRRPARCARRNRGRHAGCRRVDRKLHPALAVNGGRGDDGAGDARV